MSERTRDPALGRGDGRYVIQVRGTLDSIWGTTFADWEFSFEVNELRGITTLESGPAPDQAQLHAALRQIRDLGLELLSVQRRASDIEWSDAPG